MSVRASSPASPAFSQALTSDLLAPVPGGFVSPQNLPTRRTTDAPLQPNGTLQTSQLSPDRMPAIDHHAAVPAASGAAGTGSDALNCKRKQTKYYPGAKKPKPPVGPGSPPPPLVPKPRPSPPSAKGRQALRRPAGCRHRGGSAAAPGDCRLIPDPYAPTGVRRQLS